MSQKERIKKYLESGKGLTPLGALKLFGCFRLSGRIFDLRRELKIKTEWIERNNKRYARYSL